MKVITLAAHKGGVGKTTMTASLAVLAKQKLEAELGTIGRDKVALMDLDPQGSLTGWYNARDSQDLKLVEPMLTSLSMRASWMKLMGYRYPFIDTPPGHSEIITKAMDIAHVVVTPVRPGQMDIDAVEKTLRHRIYRGIWFLALPNGGQSRSRSMGQLIQRLDGEGHRRLPPIHNRVDFLLNDGRTITETKLRSAGAQELRQVWNAIKHTLHK